MLFTTMNVEGGYRAHPVPQNVTSFEFHLVGDMTLKQFAYLAIGFALAYLIFVFWGKSFLAWPFIVFSAITGIAFAFLPISDRPLDHWLSSFLQAIFNPTQKTYTSKNLDAKNPIFKTRLKRYLALKGQETTGEDAKKVLFSTTVANLQKPETPAVASTISSDIHINPIKPISTNPIVQKPTSGEPNPKLPTSEQLSQTVELAKEAQSIQSKILETEQQLAQIKAGAAQVGSNPERYATQFQEVLDRLQELNKSASTVSHDLAVISKIPTPNVPLPSELAKPKTAPAINLTGFPNIINGIVTDPQGNYVEGAIIVAHDRQGLPVRALKTNKLGQFVAATPLPIGEYTITTEKTNMNFQPVGVEIKDQVLKPVLIGAT